jgi:hypothetical protein
MKHAIGLVLVVVFLAAPKVRGDDTNARRVAVLPIEDDMPLAARLIAELRSQAFEPVEAGVSPSLAGDPFAPLVAATRATGAPRAIRIAVSPTGVSLWIVNIDTGKRIYREAPVATDARGDGAIISLWAVEALRASAVAPEPPAPPSNAGARRASPPAQLPTATFALQIAPAMAISSGSLGPSPQVFIGSRRFFSRRVGAEFFFLLPTVPSHLERSVGSADVSIGVAAAGPFLRAGDDQSRWSAQLGAGAAMTVVRVSGVGATAYLGQTEHVIGGGPYARAGVALRISRGFHLRADGVVGATFPEPVIYFAEDRVAGWGRPWGAAAAGVEALF